MRMGFLFCTLVFICRIICCWSCFTNCCTCLLAFHCLIVLFGASHASFESFLSPSSRINTDHAPNSTAAARRASQANCKRLIPEKGRKVDSELTKQRWCDLWTECANRICRVNRVRLARLQVHCIVITLWFVHHSVPFKKSFLCHEDRRCFHFVTSTFSVVVTVRVKNHTIIMNHASWYVNCVFLRVSRFVD